MRATCPTNVILLALITLIVLISTAKRRVYICRTFAMKDMTFRSDSLMEYGRRIILLKDESFFLKRKSRIIIAKCVHRQSLWIIINRAT
jgi:hypothetical protein